MEIKLSLIIAWVDADVGVEFVSFMDSCSKIAEIFIRILSPH